MKAIVDEQLDKEERRELARTKRKPRSSALEEGNPGAAQSKLRQRSQRLYRRESLQRKKKQNCCLENQS